MVVQRTINNLRERPKHERKAVATWIAIGIVVILLLAWVIVSLARLRSSAPNTQPQNTQPEPVATQTNAVTTNTYQTDAQIQEQSQQNIQPQGTSTIIELGATTN